MSVSASAKGLDGQTRVLPRRLLTEARLARMATTGDEAAFEEIFRRYQEQLYRYCRAILSDPDEAQDALQNAMASALRALPGEEREIALRPWLYRVAHNEAISIARRRMEPAASPEELVDAIPSAGTDADDRERLRELVADLRRLPERQRGALVMRELSDLSYSQIALALDCSEGAARQAVYEAREALREAKRGREMQCADVREVISARDGRRVRGKAIRAHLHACEVCQDFRTAISQRSADLHSLTPALPAVTAAGMLAALTGGGSAGATGVTAGTGAAAAGAGSGALVAKGNALIAALVIGAGAAGVSSGVMDVPVVGGPGDEAAVDDGSGNPHGASGASDHARANDEAGSAVGAAHGNGSGPEHAAAGQARADEHRAGAGHNGEYGQAGESGQAGEYGEADENGSGSPALGTGTEHELPDSSQGSSPPGSAVGSPHTPSSPDVTFTPGQSAEHSDAGSRILPEQSNAGGSSEG